MPFKIKNISSSFLTIPLKGKSITLKSSRISEPILFESDITDEIKAMERQGKISIVKYSYPSKKVEVSTTEIKTKTDKKERKKR